MCHFHVVESAPTIANCDNKRKLATGAFSKLLRKNAFGFYSELTGSLLMYFARTDSTSPSEQGSAKKPLTPAFAPSMSSWADFCGPNRITGVFFTRLVVLISLTRLSPVFESKSELIIAQSYLVLSRRLQTLFECSIVSISDRWIPSPNNNACSL